MQIDTIVKDVKGRAQTVADQAQAKAGQAQVAAKTSLETIKEANTIVVKGVTTIATAHGELAKDLFGEANKSFEQAKKDGVKKVASAPITYLPNGKGHVVATYNDSVKVVVKSRDELTKIVTKGVDQVQIDLGLKSAPVKKTATTAKRAATKTTAAAKKTATTARKTTAKRTSSAAKTVAAKAEKATS